MLRCTCGAALSRRACATKLTGARELSTALQVTDPLVIYQQMVRSGKLRQDEQQIRALAEIRKVTQRLMDYRPPLHLLMLLDSMPTTSKAPSDRSGAFWGLSDEETQTESRLIESMSLKQRQRALVKVFNAHESDDDETPKGFLLTGPPGTGKSMMLDLFFASLPTPHKIRRHYHHFLLSLYHRVFQDLQKKQLSMDVEEARMNETATAEGGYPWSRREEMKALAITKGWRSVFAGGLDPNDPRLQREFVLATIARDLIRDEGFILAFDEVQLVDVAGAGLLRRVIDYYWRLGGVVVGTSNRLPEDLYQQGVQRDQIQAFLSALQIKCPVIELRSSTDWRRERRTEEDAEAAKESVWQEKTWYLPAERDHFETAVRTVVHDPSRGGEDVFKVYGRRVVVPWAHEGVARFTWADLCLRALGPADYLSLASRYHTFIIDEVPTIPVAAKNEARRFITLLDSLYETKVRLICSAAAEIDSLFFPDAQKYQGRKRQADLLGLDDVLTSSGNDHPFSSDRIYEGDTQAEEAQRTLDSVTQEMISEVAQDLEAPYRPNVASYDQTAQTRSYDKAQVLAETLRPALQFSQPQVPHPSAAAPAFQDLSIFTGQDERFSFQRAVSRLHELTSPEYLRSAVHAPMPPSARSWEKEVDALLTKPTRKPMEPIGSIGPVVEVGTGKYQLPASADHLTPDSIKLRFPDGMPDHPTVQVRRRKSDGPDPTLTDMRDTHALEKPVLSPVHAWGVADWGKGSGKWGKGASAKEPKGER